MGRGAPHRKRPDRDLAAAYLAGGKVQAVATLRRDQASLRAEIAFEQNDEARLQALAPPGEAAGRGAPPGVAPVRRRGRERREAGRWAGRASSTTTAVGVR